MGLIELIGESYDPGDVGTVDQGRRERERPPTGWRVFYFLVAVAVLAGWAYLVWFEWEVRSLDGVLGIAAGTGVYLLLGYFLHPKPDTSNVGWVGGLIDHPFRFSDDVNRFLIFLMIVLWPGRFVAESLLGVYGGDTEDEDLRE